MKAVPKLGRQERGVALVVVMAILALILITVVAFLTSAALERGTARAFSNTYQAKLAAESGLAAAMQTFTRTSTGTVPTTPNSGVADNDLFIVVRSENPSSVPYYSVGLARPKQNPPRPEAPPSEQKVDYVPLVSGGVVQTDIESDKLPVVSQMLPPPSAAEPPLTDIRVYPWINTPQAKWVTVEAPKSAGSTLPPTRMRYAYWVEDLGGYLDVGYDTVTADPAAKKDAVGNIDGPAAGHKRPMDVSSADKRYQYSPKEIALYTVFEPKKFPDVGTEPAKAVVENRPLLLTPLSAAQLTSKKDAPNFMANGFFFEDEPVLVPRGFGYLHEGEPAKNLNQLLQPSKVDEIALWITDNLPKFASDRRGGLASSDYNKTLAASMIDYADTDSAATVGSNYRGMDSYPLVSEIYNSKEWKGVVNRGGSFHVQVEVQHWVELWNMSNQSISGSVEFDFKENHPITFGVNEYTFEEPAGPDHVVDYPRGQRISVALAPNAYRVVLARRDTYYFDTGVSPPLIFPPTGPPAPVYTFQASKTSTYEMRWTSSNEAPALVDRSKSGLQRVQKNFRPPPNAQSRRWSGTIPGFSGVGTALNDNAFRNNLGDPRVAYSLVAAQGSNDYDLRGSMGGRNKRNGITVPPGEVDYAEVRPSAWPDGGHDSTPGTPAGSESTPPSEGVSGSQPSMAPMYISNRGNYFTLAELGNIFEPGLWEYNYDSNKKRWTEVKTTPTASSGYYGGGSTLRIGRPEFTRFDVPGLRARQLLDLFTTDVKLSTRGKVNINTASRDVLRALGGGLLMNRDPDIKPPELAGKLTSPTSSGGDHADRFADAVIAARPFLTPSQLARVNAFGNPGVYPSTEAPTEWNDAGTEEYFAKVFPLSTVRSRNFRVFVTGQVVDRNNRPIATTHRVYQIQVRPNRNPGTGAIGSQSVVVYESTL